MYDEEVWRRSEGTWWGCTGAHADVSLDPAQHPGAAALLAVPQNCPSGDLLEGIDMLLLFRYPAPPPSFRPGTPNYHFPEAFQAQPLCV